MAKQELLAKIALGACCFSLCVIALGAFTRLIDAGLGCPDWPGCYGHFYPQTALSSSKAWAEMVHRYFVAGLSVFILSIIFFIFSQKTLRTRVNLLGSLLLILLLVYQILLGQWTVTLKLLPIVVTQHLLGGFFILATLWMLYVANSIKSLASENVGWIFVGACTGVVLLLTQILLGAWTSTNYASLSCNSFPLCDSSNFKWQFKQAFALISPVGINYEGGVLPLDARQTIQMMHRIGALVLTTYLFIFASVCMLKVKSISVLKSVYIVMALLLLQVCLGISNVLFKLPLHSAIAHTVVAALLLLAMISLMYKLAVIKR